MLGTEVILISICTLLENGFRQYIETGPETGLKPSWMVCLGSLGSLLILFGMGVSLDALAGWRQWIVRVVPIAVALSVREIALNLLGSCCGLQLVVVYSSASMLLLAIPLYLAIREQFTTSSYCAIIASLLLFLVEYDGEQACRLECLLPVFAVSAGLSLGILLFFIYGNETDGGSLAPALMTVGLLSFGHLFGGPAPFVPIILQGMNRVVLFTCIIRTSRMSSPFTDVYFAALGGSCLPEVFGGSVAKLSLVVVCGTICMVHLTVVRPKVTETLRLGVARGKLGSVLSLVVLMFVAFYPIAGAGAEGSGSGTGVRHKAGAKTHAPSGVSHGPVATELKPFYETYDKGTKKEDRLVNGVIVYMDSKRKPIEKALILVQENFLVCWPYPVHVFKEGVTEKYKEGVRSLTTSKVSFTEIGHFFDAPPGNMSMTTLNFWIDVMKYGRGHHFGYRMMCRFFSGLFAQYEFLKQYDFYWRLDTDSWIRDQVLVDPFRHMVVKGCRYGHISRHHSDVESVTRRLYPTVLEWAHEYNAPDSNVTRLNNVVTSRNGEYRRLMYYNNFEIASVPWITGPDYTSFFEYLDFTDGFMKYRWGDAPVRTLAVHLMMGEEEICDFESYLPYHHGRYKNKAYDPGRLKRPMCPSSIMYMDESAKMPYYPWPPRYYE